MKRLNRILAALAIAVLIGTLSLLYWLRARTYEEIDRTIRHTQSALQAREILHGPGGETLGIRCGGTGRRTGVGKSLFPQHPRHQTGGDQEAPIVPFTLPASLGPNWKAAMSSWTRVALAGESGQPYGYLYFDEDPARQRPLNWAIARPAWPLCSCWSRCWRGCGARKRR